MRTNIVVLAVTMSLCACDGASNDPAQEQIDVASAHPSNLAAPVRDCESAQNSRECALVDVSMIQLIARPELFEGRRVRVVGFVNLEPEDNGLYLARSDWENGIRKNGVWIEEPPDSVDGTKNWRWNRRYVLVEGVFTAKSKGHLGLWSGQISGVQRYDPWKGEPPRDDEKRVSR